MLWELLRWLLGGWGTAPEAGAATGRARFNALNVPNFRPGANEDSLDLQVKALRYVFYRVQIPAIAPFLAWDDNTGEMVLDHHFSGNLGVSGASNASGTILMTPKLDKVYNIDGFKAQLVGDPHRVLVDWSKNKARSMLLLSGAPKSVSIPDLHTPGYAFVILPPDAADETYIETLVHHSGLFAEHRVPAKVRTQCALKALNKQHQRAGGEPFTLDDRSEIIEGYLNRLAIHVQVHRLYSAKLRAKEKERTNVRVETIGSYKSMKGAQAAQSAPGDCSDTTTSSFLGHLFTNDEKSLWWDQSLMAVRIRVEKERYAL